MHKCVIFFKVNNYKKPCHVKTMQKNYTTITWKHFFIDFMDSIGLPKGNFNIPTKPHLFSILTTYYFRTGTIVLKNQESTKCYAHEYLGIYIYRKMLYKLCCLNHKHIKQYHNIMNKS